MKKLLHIALISFLLAGCAGPLKQTWQNFNAYYNTFYNARHYFNEGLQKNIRQAPELNPHTPIRVHLPPTAAGQEDFLNAIERGASILRDHEESKYVTRALALIGKSYYYRSEFFDALEKFREIQAIGNSREIQEAVLWQGRTYLEMDAVGEGIRFLESERGQTEEWFPDLQAEVDVILAQLYTRQGDIVTALSYLAGSIAALSDRNLMARAYFLQGQLFEQTENFARALYSYSRIQEIRTTYNLEYNALKKEAEVSRTLGNYNHAQNLYNHMARDDKFIEHHDDLQYEIARTWHQQGARDRALDEYNTILKNRLQPPPNTVQAKTYFGIGEVYRDHFNNYLMAAAYFDSAVSVQADPSNLPAYYNADVLAESFGEYAAITRERMELDSLLYLGNMPSAELDSVLAEIQRVQTRDRDDEAKRLREMQDQIVIVDDSLESLPDASEVTEDGFLNIRNSQRMLEASLQFQAIWGDRPLADDWRRRTEVPGSRFDQPVVLSNGENEEIAESPEAAAMPGGVDVSGIPLSEDAKQQTRNRIEELNYNLANVFFLSLDKPDSARVYYEKVAESSTRQDLVTRSLYSLAEIELLEGNTRRAREWSQRLIDNYPESVYAQRIAERLELPHSVGESRLSAEDRYADLIQSDRSDPAEVAEELKLLAIQSTAARRPYLLFEAAKEYMKAAKAEVDSSAYSAWLASLEAREEPAEDKVKDQVRAAFPFEGAYWDSSRAILDRIDQFYDANEITPQVRRLKEVLQKPEPEPALESEDDLSAEETFQLCNELNPSVEMEPEMDTFLSLIVPPEWASDMTIRGEIRYRFTIRPDGTVEGYEQESRMDRSGIPQAYEQAFEEHLRFKQTQRTANIRCSVVFPINL